jgi:hypothetical protein
LDKKKFTLPQQRWATLKTKYRPESNFLSTDELTAGSTNFITNLTGSLDKRQTDIQYNPSALSVPGRDQFEAIFSTGNHHLLFMDNTNLQYTTGDTLIHTAQTGLTAAASMEYTMFQDRVYLDDGVDNPLVYDITPSYGGVTYTVPQVKAMGCQVPATTLTAALNIDSTANQVPAGAHTYKVTYLYYGFEESNGSASSNLVTNDATHTSNSLTNIPTGGYGVTARNIYRDNHDGVYLLLTTIADNTTTTFTDNLAIGATPTPMPTFNDLPPTFSWIVSNLSRLWVAGVEGNPTIIYWSNPDQPDVWDPENSLQCNPEDPIQGLFVYNGVVWVFNRHSIGQILGNTDDTFYYFQLPNAVVGTTDNRSIQIRIVSGYPELVWLSDKGFYHSNGSSVDYLSDPIEDLVNFNIQQSNFATGSTTQSTEAQYSAGTSSPGIDLTDNPGVIETINPTKIFQVESDWISGTITNLSTEDGTNTLKVPVAFAPTIGSGTLSGDATISGSNVTLPSTTDFTGESHSIDQVFNTGNHGSARGTPDTVGECTDIAQAIIPPRSGTLVSVSLPLNIYSSSPATVLALVYNDSFGSPGAVLFSQAIGVTAFGAQGPITLNFSPNVSMTGGTKYWIGVRGAFGSFGGASNVSFGAVNITNSTWTGGSPALCRMTQTNNGAPYTSWEPLRNSDGNAYPALGTFTGPWSFAGSYVFSATAISDSGGWTSQPYDSASLNIGSGMSLITSGSYPSSTSSSVLVQGSTSNSPYVWNTTDTLSSPNGTTSLTGGNYRYWRIIQNIATTDNRNVPSMGAPTLDFNTTGTWISPAILTTTDTTAFLSMNVIDSIPAGTSVTATIATSADNITYSAYTALGSATPSKWAKLKLVLVANGSDTVTPSVTSDQLNWTITSVFTSSIINIGQTPSGWGLFQDAQVLNGGTLTLQMRSASTSGGISSATFYTVTNGTFPPAGVVPNEYTQYQATFISTPNNIPQISSVTINWFTGTNATPIRVASLFYNRNYYLAAATTGAATNNIVIVYDQDGYWRTFSNININSLSLFFNQPFYLDAVRDYLYQWLIPANGTGNAIPMSVRTKAFDFGNIENLKAVRSCRIKGLETGTTIHAYYSIDRGTTWVEMIDSLTGNLGYTTGTSGNAFYRQFVPNWDPATATDEMYGLTVMFRVDSNDNFPCSIMNIEPNVYVHTGLYLPVQGAE